MTDGLRSGLIDTIQQLLRNLTGYHRQHGELIGDWALHNLVFSPQRGAIVNVDVEGFFTCVDGEMEAQLPFVESNLLNLLELLKITKGQSADDAKIVEVFKALDRVRRSGTDYSAVDYVAGYHSIELKGKKFRGQRECSDRLAQVPFDFHGKVVFDLGCNVGGMLHPLSNRIRRGFGCDANPDCVNAAQLIKRLNQSSNLEFFTFDLDHRPLPHLQSLISHEKVDICFLLSMCMWLKCWQEVIFEASQISEHLLFESNGSQRQQDEQVALLRKCYKEVQLLSGNSLDDFEQRDRKLFLCRRQA
jgi:SAM-dependent methyltransferase